MFVAQTGNGKNESKKFELSKYVLAKSLSCIGSTGITINYLWVGNHGILRRGSNIFHLQIDTNENGFFQVKKGMSMVPMRFHINGDSDLMSETTGAGYHSGLRGVERLRTAMHVFRD